ncbi:phosphate ABC transporter permease subunit PstC [Haloglomus litoreum]|uniref:phosphate ABC transporter permease subunit PstC n=1 Tax=Haloglomus litoreum TaxID=3034026 RepID=UPI0023E7E6AB|nr:phosphate ABC transporter permease subunit PstC [Haloglomus sp. DT116]
MLGSVGLETKLRERDIEPGAAAVVGGGALLLVLAFVSFLLNTGLSAVPLFLFVGVAAYGWVRHQAETARGLMLLATTLGVLILTLIVVFLFLEARQAFELMGLDILLRTEAPVWSVNEGVYGLAVAVHGTIVTTIIAMLIAAPLGIAGALFISEIAPDRVGDIVKPGIEILAGIPSIVYGFIGFAILNQYFQVKFSLANFGSLLLAGMMIGLMALPTVVSVSEDAINAIPESMKSGSLALGATDWQTMKGITLPAAFSGVSAGVILGVGRAIGETMAATVILGNIPRNFAQPLPDVFDNTATLTSLIASQYGVAVGRANQLSALFAAGVLLFVIVMILSVASQRIEARMRRKLEGEV